jgi:hypothetical protein
MFPLTRAGVYQEGLLASVVHSARDEVLWECHELRASEEFPVAFLLGIPPFVTTNFPFD